MSNMHEVEDDYEAAEMSNIATPDVTTTHVNRILFNMLEELLLTNHLETVIFYLIVAIVIFLLPSSSAGNLLSVFF